ncbi:MAG: O-antigen ligase family protein [Trueperaceae bacterium]
MILPRLLSESPRRPSSNILFALAGIAVGAALGFGIAYLPLLVYLAVGGVAAALMAFLMIRYTHWTMAFFFLAYALQTTVLGVVGEIRGLYYPLYLLMLFNAVVSLISGRAKVSVGIIVTYALFYTMVIFSLFTIATPVGFDLFQRLVIYLLAIMGYFQFASEKSFKEVMNVQIWAALIIAGWVILDAAQSGFAGRGISEIDQNNVTTNIALGLIPLFAFQILSKSNWVIKLLGWLALIGGIYATLLLASRGVTTALAVAFLVMIVRVFNNPRRSIPLLLVVAIAGITIANLPGSGNLIERFNQGDVSSANGRVPLWNAAIREIENAPAPQLLFGHGYNYSLLVTNRVVGFLYSVHNTYLQMAIDFGLLGVGFFIFLHLIVIRLLWRHGDALSIYAIGTVVFLLIINMTLQAADGFLYWISLGVTLAIATWRDLADPHQSATLAVLRKFLPVTK